MRSGFGYYFLSVAAMASAAAAQPCANLPLSNIGCEFYAATLPNPLLDQSTFYFSVSLHNPGVDPVQVTITRGASILVSGQVIAAGAVAEFQLPWVSALSITETSTAVVDGAYHVVTTGPVTAIQLNPRDYTRMGTFAYTLDSSLLLPLHAAGVAYRPAVWPTHRISSTTQRPGFVAIVGISDGTSVTVAPTGALQAGGGLTSVGGTVVLDADDVVLAASALDGPSDPSYGSDLSGTLITASAPVIVFAGHACPYIPANQGFCDHLEESVPPIATLATDHLVELPFNSHGTPRHFVKVVADSDDTNLSFDPAAVAPPTTLDAGEVLTFEATAPFRVHSTARVLVASFLEGESMFPNPGSHRGDPAQTHIVPVAQTRSTSAFLAPPNFTQNWAQLVAPAGAAITVDGAAATGWTAIGGTGYETARVALCGSGAGGCTGAHAASGDSPFSIALHGYAQYTSYAHPAGMDLDPVLLEDGFEWGNASAWSSVSP